MKPSQKVIWTEPGRDFRDSMPIGNGELGANVWIESTGEIYCYLARTDAWSENARLLKLGRIRISISDSSEMIDGSLQQVLSPEAGTITFSLGSGDQAAEILIYVDSESNLTHYMST